MVRNKDSGFPGERHLDDPKAKDEHAPLRPNGQTAARPQERMVKGTK